MIRRRTQADLLGCVTLLEAVHVVDQYPSAWPDDPAGWLNPPDLLCSWVALRDATIVGHVGLGHVGADSHLITGGRSTVQMGEVKRLFVSPVTRGTGVAERLLDVAARFARAQGLHAVLEVRVDSLAAISLYEKRGWRQVRSHRAHWTTASGERPLLYLYELPAARDRQPL